MQTQTTKLIFTINVSIWLGDCEISNKAVEDVFLGQRFSRIFSTFEA